MDEERFATLYRSCAVRLWTYLYRACGDAATADDLCQDVFLRVLQRQAPFAGEDEMKVRLFSMATYRLRDLWRERRRHHFVPLASIPEGSQVPEAEPAAEIAEAFRSLKPREQALLWMAHAEGLDHAAIARSLSLRERSVRVLLFRARRRLAVVLRRDRDRVKDPA